MTCEQFKELAPAWALGALDEDEPPRLAQADRGGEACRRDQPVERAGRQRIGAEAPHIASPRHEVAQPGAKLSSKSIVEQ